MSIIFLYLQITNAIIETKAIKPGPRPKKEDGTTDKRRMVTPEKKPEHPTLKPHEHKPGD
ncbi:hypothetical protein VO54_01489 [Elizabethkingia miricola]|nr:hypothetical protein VO54_01489 [Elizabethkingia miricola]